MKRNIMGLLLVTALFVPNYLCAQATTWKQIPIPPLRSFRPQQPKRIELSNGMVIFLQEDHELPLIDGTARIRGGSSSEPANKVGLVDIYGDVWRTGGTKSQTGDQLDEVPGIAFRITQSELAATDAYEVADCKRVTVRLGSGLDAFVYVDARP